MKRREVKQKERGSVKRTTKEDPSRTGLVVSWDQSTSRLRCIGKKTRGQKGRKERVGPLFRLGWSDEWHHGTLNVFECPWVSLTSSWIFLARGRSQTTGKELSSRNIRVRGPPLMIKSQIFQSVSHKNHIYRVIYLYRSFTFTANGPVSFLILSYPL